jgi:hypothetical protein
MGGYLPVVNRFGAIGCGRSMMRQLLVLGDATRVDKIRLIIGACEGNGERSGAPHPDGSQATEHVRNGLYAP